MLVLDASAAVDLLLGLEPGSSRLRNRTSDYEGGFHVPYIFELEVVSTFRGLNLSGELPEWRAAEALEDLRDMRLVRYPHASFMERMWELRNNITVYDAAYIVLAETLDAPLLTSDGRLARSSGHRASVEVFA